MSTKDEQGWLNFCSPNLNWKAWIGFLVLLAGVCLLVGLLEGCAANKGKVKVPTAEEAKKEALAQGPLVQEPIEKRYKFPPGRAAGVKNGTVVTTTDGKTIVWGAVVLDEDKVKQQVVIKAERNRLIEELKAEKLKSRAQKIIYTKTIERLRQDALPTWWGKYKWSILAPTLIAIGGAIVTGIVYALTKGSGITVNANSVVLPPVHR